MTDLKPVGMYREMYEHKKPQSRHDELPSITESFTERPIEDRAQVLGYMKAAPGVFDVTDSVTDLINGTDRIGGASSLSSDGKWIWRTDSLHYLTNHDLDIPDEFLQYVRERNYTPPNAIEFTDEFDSAMLKYF